MRWTVWIYLLLLALTGSEVLREGVVVYSCGDVKLVLDSSFWWLAWFATINLAARFPWLLVPAAAAPALLLRYTPLDVVVDYGLARLGWLDAVHSPVLATVPWAVRATACAHAAAAAAARAWAAVETRWAAAAPPAANEPGWSDPAWARFWAT